MKKRIENIFTGVASNIVYGLLLLLVTYIGLKFDDKSLDDYLHSYSFRNSGKLSLVPYTKDFGRITHF